MHGLEEIAGVPYVLKKDRTRFIIEDKDGTVTERDIYCHDFIGIKQEYQRIKDILAYPDIKTGKVAMAGCFLIDSRALAEKALAMLREDPYCFVSK